MFMLTQSKNIHLKYRIIKGDKEIGFSCSEIETGKINDQLVVKKESIWNVRIGGFLKNEESIEVETILFKNGNIIRYEGLSNENDKYSSVCMRNIGGLFIIDSEYGKQKSIDLLELKDFDCTSEELVPLFLSSEKKSATYQVFDLSRFDIEQVEVNVQETETIDAINKKWPCQVVIIKNLSQPVTTKKWMCLLDDQLVSIKEVEVESGDEKLVLLGSLETGS